MAREKAGKSLSSDVWQSTLVLFYIYLPPFSPYAVTPKVWVFFSHFLFILILSKPRILLPPHPAILPSWHIFLFLILFVQSHLALQIFLSSTFPLLFSFYGHNPHPVLSHSIRLRLFPDCFPQQSPGKCLSPLNPIKMLFISIMLIHSHQHLKIRTKLSLFFIFFSITHNVIMLVSLSLQQKSWKHYPSVVFYTFSEHNQNVFIKILQVQGWKSKPCFSEKWGVVQNPMCFTDNHDIVRQN